MRRRPVVAGLALIAATAVVVVGRSGLTAGSEVYTPDLSRGAAIYAEACAACHGAALEGQTDWRIPGPDGRLPAPPHDVTGHTWHHPDRVLLDITTRGTAAVVGGGYESDMPGFGDVYTQDELRDVLEWIKTHWPAPARAHQAETTRADATER